MTARTMLFGVGGAALVLLGLLVTAVGGYAAFVSPCGVDDGRDGGAGDWTCFDAWSVVTYAGGTLVVVGVFSLVYARMQFAHG